MKYSLVMTDLEDNSFVVVFQDAKSRDKVVDYLCDCDTSITTPNNILTENFCKNNNIEFEIIYDTVIVRTL